jgi:hypothetical protein
MTAASALTALIAGVAAGWIFQRGRTCMNSAFRDIIFVNDMTLMRVYVLALLITMAGANALEDFGLIDQLRRQALVPMANMLGGFIFGLGIVLAGGCGSGIWFRVGEGAFASWTAVWGFFAGISATNRGILKPVNDLLKRFQLWVTLDGIQALGAGEVEDMWDRGMEVDVPTLYGLLGVNKWMVIAALALLSLPFLLKGGTKPPRVGYPWHITGTALGITAVFAWWASDAFGGGARGLSYSMPTSELFDTVILGSVPTWSAFMVLGTPIGAYLSARGLNEFKLKANPEDMVRSFIGGIVMGVGAVIGGGCNIGHGLTGISTLALSSILATGFIICGNWLMVYFLFIRPMED